MENTETSQITVNVKKGVILRKYQGTLNHLYSRWPGNNPLI